MVEGRAMTDWIDWNTTPPQHPKVPVLAKYGRLHLNGTIAEILEQVKRYPCEEKLLWRPTGIYLQAMEEVW